MEQDQAWVQGQIECIAPSEVSTASSMVTGSEADSAIDGGLAVVRCWCGNRRWNRICTITAPIVITLPSQPSLNGRCHLSDVGHRLWKVTRYNNHTTAYTRWVGNLGANKGGGQRAHLCSSSEQYFRHDRFPAWMFFFSCLPLELSECWCLVWQESERAVNEKGRHWPWQGIWTLVCGAKTKVDVEHRLDGS